MSKTFKTTFDMAYTVYVSKVWKFQRFLNRGQMKHYWLLQQMVKFTPHLVEFSFLKIV